MDVDFNSVEQKQLDAAMPWIGLYIAAASAICTLAMAADAFNGFRLGKLWFPCKYFSLNAMSLALLAVAMKLAMDLNSTSMLHSATDRLAKISSLIFMSTAQSNFMSSLGSMNDKAILANVVALGILVTTLTADAWIELFLLEHMFGPLIIVYMMPSILMLLSLATLVSLAITVPTTKRSLESKYRAKQKVASREEEVLNRREAFGIDDQRRHMMKYLVMAETSSPQFVMARSVVCTTSALISLFAAFILAGLHVLMGTGERAESLYRGYTKWILYVQSTGVAIGTIAPIFRWFVLVSFKCWMINWSSFKEEFKIEGHWIQTLVELRESSSALHTWRDKYWKYLHDVKWIAITFCIGLQILTVLVSKLLVFLSALLMSPFFLCFNQMKKFMKQHCSKYVISNSQIGHESGDDTDLNLGRYVLLLEGEAELPKRVLKNICHEADDIIKAGRKKQPLCLVNLLNKFVNFNGVGHFDSNQISSLHSQEPPNCWTLPVVTLTSISIALPHITKHKRKRLLSSVSEGLSFAKIVEKTLVKNAELVNIRKAANICWVGVLLYMKWLDIDLKRMSLKCRNSKQVLQELSNKAEKRVMEFKREVKDSVMENPLNWPTEILTANSMYRISQTILLSYEEENEQTDEALFERLSAMIADILVACLTNLPNVITTMCHHNAIEKRERSVRKAFFLLGKTEEIVELVQQQEWPALGHDRAAYIEEWRALFQQDKDEPAASTSTSSDEIVRHSSMSSEEHLAITVDC